MNRQLLPVLAVALVLVAVPDLAFAQDDEGWIIPQMVGLFVGIPIALLLLALSALELLGAVLVGQAEDPSPMWTLLGRGGLIATLLTILFFVLPMLAWLAIFGVFFWSMPDIIWAGASAGVMFVVALIAYVCSRVLVVRSLAS